MTKMYLRSSAESLSSVVMQEYPLGPAHICTALFSQDWPSVSDQRKVRLTPEEELCKKLGRLLFTAETMSQLIDQKHMHQLR